MTTIAELLWRVWTLEGVVLAILAFPTLGMAATVAYLSQPERGPRQGRAQATHLGLFALGGVAALIGMARGWEALGKLPDAVYVVERDGERRIAVVGDASFQAQQCFVRTTTLDRRLRGQDGYAGGCRLLGSAAWAEGRRGGSWARPIDLWKGVLLPPLHELAARDGPLPGAGEVAVRELLEGAATVRLQDGTSRRVQGPSTAGVRRLRAETGRPQRVPAGVHQAAVLQDGCCARADCEALVLFSDVAFVTGRQHLGQLGRATDGAPTLRWSTPTETLLGNQRPIAGLTGGSTPGACTMVGLAPPMRVVLGELDLATGIPQGRPRLH